MQAQPSSLLAPNGQLVDVLAAAAPGAVRSRATDRLAVAHDASHYLLTPEALVVAHSAEEVGRLFQAASAHGFAMTFRSGGTSLSGQAGSDQVLVDVRRNFRQIEILDQGARVRVQPGTTVRAVNTHLARHGRKLGPDPASEIACTIGGVVANNSSGMACGTELNTYRTLDSAIIVLPSGTVVDTGTPDADDRLRLVEPEMYDGLARLRDRIRGNPAAVATIRRLFAIKNTMGYGINTFLDHHRPIDLLLHLIVGSEGTLGFVAEATFRTVPSHPYAATGLLIFNDLADATASLPDLVASDFATIELLDSFSLRVAQQNTAATSRLQSLQVDKHTALLVEHQQPNAESLAEHAADSAELLNRLPLAVRASLTSDPGERAGLWHIRKGLYTAVAGARPSGTTALLEDIAVPVENLLPTCQELAALFKAHRYDDSVIFGHAKDGNIHFLLNERFDQPHLVQRYLNFTEEMVTLILDQGGTLKAEHGTGRIMAPFVRRQYGDELYQVMRDIKQLFDPRGLLNPGVVLDDNPLAHIDHLKSAPTVEAEVDRCVECGYCEPTCPSKDLTTTPRQRIVLRREIVAAQQRGEKQLAEQLADEYEYDAVQTCAVDGMCVTACPVLINTGDLTRRLRAESAGPVTSRLWSAAAAHWDLATAAGGKAMSAAKTLPATLPRVGTIAARKILGDDTVPAWSPDLPRGGSPRQPIAAANPAAVYFPACISNMFGPATPDGPGVKDAFLTLCQRANIEICTPRGIASMCCGTPWKSKGFLDGYETMRAVAVPALLEATHGGAIPVVVDAASCTEGLVKLAAEQPSLTIIDAVAFVAETVLPRLTVPSRISSIVLHPTCSSAQLGINAALQRVAEAVADQVVLPDDWGCCAFAGDRGLLHPELTASATAAETQSVARHPATAYASLNRTCELGMTRATGHPYQHILELLAKVST